MVSPLPRVHSGIQKQVLSLFREALRCATKMPDKSASLTATTYIRNEFRDKAANVDRLDFQRVEHLLRAARKKIDSLSGKYVSGFQTTVQRR
jgi:hypothetical protein